MLKVIAIHSFRGGTGKSNITANIALMIASTGKRVGIVDSDLQSPGIHVLFGLEQNDLQHTLNNYLWEQCTLKDVVYDVTPNAIKARNGMIVLAPGSYKIDEITRIVQEGYDITTLGVAVNQMAEDWELDYLFVDTHPGISNESIMTMGLSDILLTVMRPDNQDFQGTAVAVDISRHLDIPARWIIVNKVLSAMHPAQVKATVEKTYDTPVAALLPASDDLMLLGSAGLFCIKHPQHPFTEGIKQVARILINHS
ncbi:MAG: MinD/ParA family ATP-binding protein [Prochlorotrichaceae cyanobacterium]